MSYQTTKRRLQRRKAKEKFLFWQKVRRDAAEAAYQDWKERILPTFYMK